MHKPDIDSQILVKLSQNRKMAAIEHKQRARLADLVKFARSYSPYYRELYQGIPDEVDVISLLPITNKKNLMVRFDDWVTDPMITLDKVQAFVDDPNLVGEQFLGKYHVAVTSGTTGNHGIFLTDDFETAISAKINRKAKFSWIGIRGVLKLLLRGFRLAAITATGEHFGFMSGINYMRKESNFWRQRVNSFSVHMPMSELVDQLNKFQPTLVMGYASIIALLASEQELGHLHICPIFIEVMSEKLIDSEFQRIGKIFNVRPYQMYGSTENPFASSICKQGWYHINSDVVILEPVDTEYRPVPAGTFSHTVLVTNLVCRTQPIIRYDLGDSIEMRPDFCPCGNPHPAIKVQGRAADALVFKTLDGEKVMVPPLLFVTLIDRMHGIELFQVVQTSPTTLRIRLHYLASIDNQQQDRQWQFLCNELTKFLTGHKLGNISFERASEPPELSRGGKFRMVIPLA